MLYSSHLTRIYLGFYLFHESMLESVIYARDHFLRSSESDASTLIFPSHAYLVCTITFHEKHTLGSILLVLCSIR